MKRTRIFMLSAVLALTGTALGQGTDGAAAARAPQAQTSPAPRPVDLKASDGAILKASYFAAVKPGHGVLLFHQSNRTRKEWGDVAAQLAAAGINTLTVDSRGHGESGGKYDKRQRPLDLGAAARRKGPGYP